MTFNTCRFRKTMLGEVDHLLRLYLTIPLTSATAVDIFNIALAKIVFAIYRDTKRFNHLISLHMYKKNVSEMSLYRIAQDFISRNSRQTQFFWHFLI